MELRQLAYVVAIVDEGTFTAAARACYVAQPSLSQAVKAVENELGIQLFERVGRRALPTAAGEAFVAAARDVLRDVERVRAAVSDVAAALSGRLDLVALPTLALDPVAPLIGAFRRAHPGVSVRLVQPEDVAALGDIVREGRCEVGLTELPLGQPGLVALPLGDQELLAVCPPGTVLPDRPWLKIDELAELSLVTSPHGTSTRRLLDQAFVSVGVEPTIAVETDQREAIVALVLAGAGATVLPRAVADQAAVSGAVVRRLRPALRRRVGAVHRRAPLSPAATMFVEICSRHQ
jgi:LysR family transcriptional regulator, carnitine catabolism transcriptional activator